MITVTTYNRQFAFDVGDDMVTDGYHTMAELYDVKRALCVMLFNFLYSDGVTVYKTKLHSDGTLLEGYFLVTAELDAGDISFHFGLEHWNKFDIPEEERALRYDGHTTQDVIKRLEA